MRLPPLTTLILLVAGATLGWNLTSCTPARDHSRTIALFQGRVPESPAFQQDLEFLQSKGLLRKSEREMIEKQLAAVENTLGVPRNLLWCVLFQESRFDPLKNAFDGPSARGLGQFTETALQEINEDTDNYDERTGHVLSSQMKPAQFPINFALGSRPGAQRYGRYRASLKDIPRNSYFHSATAVHASGAYLNNRYWQLRRALEQQNIDFDPELLWLYAAAAYNKGARTVFSLLTQQTVSRGPAAVSELLQNPTLTYLLLTDPEVLDRAFAEMWPKRTRQAYVEEMTRNMTYITGCLLPGGRL